MSPRRSTAWPRPTCCRCRSHSIRSRSSQATTSHHGAPRSAASCATGSRSSACSRSRVYSFLRYWLAIVGVFMLAIIILMAIFAPMLTPWPPNWIDFSTGARQPPSPEHVLGTGVSARDVWSRVLYGARTSIMVGFGAVALYLVIGTLFGLAGGFFWRVSVLGVNVFIETR